MIYLKYNKSVGFWGNLFLLKKKLNKKDNVRNSSNGSVPYIPANLSYKPKITFVILGDGNRAYNSLVNQNYIYVKVVKFQHFIFTDTKKSDYICFVNGSDFFCTNAVYKMVEALQKERYDAIYFDEELDGKPFYKPDWSPNTLKSFNYIGNILIKSEYVRLFTNYYKFLISLIDKKLSIYHLSKIIYKSSRKFEESPKGKSFIKDRVSIIIPSKDNHEVLARCVNSIREKSTYKNYEIIVVDNGSSDTNKPRNIADKYVYDKFEFNFSKMCNMGAERATGDYLIFLNDDTEIITPDWMEILVAHGSDERVGAVGAKLYYPDSDTIQHCGVVDIQPGPVHYFSGFSDSDDLYFGRNKYTYNVSAVTAACLLIKKDKFKGFDEDFSICYNDIDLCYSLLEDGYFNVIVNDVKLYHYESLSRGNDKNDLSKLKRLAVEKEKLYAKHFNSSCNDRFYNVNLSWHRADFSVEIPDIIIPVRYNDKECPSMKCRIEYLYVRDNVLYIGGYINESGLHKVYIELDNGEKYIADTNKEIRPDLGVLLGKNYALNGFSSAIDIRRFKGYCFVNILAENRFGKTFRFESKKSVEFE